MSDPSAVTDTVAPAPVASPPAEAAKLGSRVRDAVKVLRDEGPAPLLRALQRRIHERWPGGRGLN